MTRRERFIKTLKGEPTDKIPVFDFLDSKNLVKHFTGIEPSSYLASDVMILTKELNLDAAFIPFGGFAGYSLDLPEELLRIVLKENQYMDEWGVLYQSNGSSWPADAPVIHPIADRDDFNRLFKVPDAHSPGRLDGIYEAIEMNKGYDCAILGGLNGPFTIALMLMGLENMSYAIADDPQLLHEIMEGTLEFLIPAAKLVTDAGVDAVFVADDLGYCGGSFFSTENMREFYFPYLKRLNDVIREQGSYVCFHSCGNITSVFSDIIMSGAHAINPIQRSAGMDIEYIKKTYGHKVTLIGNLDSTNLLPNGDEEQVRQGVREVMELCAPGGRYIFASDSDARDDQPLQNILAMFDEADKISDFTNYNT